MYHENMKVSLKGKIEKVEITIIQMKRRILVIILGLNSISFEINDIIHRYTSMINVGIGSDNKPVQQDSFFLLTD